MLVNMLFYDLCVSFFKIATIFEVFRFILQKFKIVYLISNYFLARSLERCRYFISSEHCIILRNIVVVYVLWFVFFWFIFFKPV